jgi:hypothetical protein
MSARNKFVKVRLSPDEYNDVLKRADTQGLTMCEHIRTQLLTVHEQLDLRSELSTLRDQLTASSATPTDTNPLALEAVLILRELAAGRDAQILGRVRSQLAAGRAAA